jgi:gliding motility-associated-like protein
MRRWAFHICILLIAIATRGQDCPDLLNPLAGSNNVPVDTSISWEEVIGVTGYIISLGTTPGGTEIINEQAVGSDTSYTPPLGLPESTQVYVTLTLFIFNQDNVVCNSISFTTENVTTVPECTTMLIPVNGEINVNVGTFISWAYASRAIGYRISLGTSAGAGDIVNNQDVGNVLSFDPPSNLPPATEIFVTIFPYNENGDAVNCPSESFTTGALGEPPGCTSLITPSNGQVNVALNTIIEWIPVASATGYIVSVGSSPFINDVLDMVIFTTTVINVINFEPNKTYFVRIIPFNEAGQAQGCIQESFSTILGCGPFFDPVTGALITFYPDITMPDEIGICENDIPTRIEAPDIADGYRWYKLSANQPEILISDENYVLLSEPGQYRYEAYNVLTQEGFKLECPADKLFTAILSGLPSIDRIRIEEDGMFFNISIEVRGLGDYEYSLNSTNAWMDSNNYSGLTPGDYILYVRDKNGCGIVERSFRLAFPPPGFPPYFSPNGDGIKDYWQYIPPEKNPLPLTTVYIYDRYGKILSYFSADGPGWDGLFDGTPMPLGGYWYRALAADGQVYRGYFSLIR